MKKSSRRKISKRKDKPASDYDIYIDACDRYGVPEADRLDASSLKTAMAAVNEKIELGYRKRGDLLAGPVTIARYQSQGGHTDEQINAMVAAYNKRGVEITREEFIAEKLWTKVGHDIHAINEQLKAMGMSGKERARYIGQQIYGSE